MFNDVKLSDQPIDICELILKKIFNGNDLYESILII